MDGHALPVAMRPDRSGVVLDLNETGTIIAHCEQPQSWKREPMRSWLLQYARRTTVILETPASHLLLAKTGRTEDLIQVGVDPQTNNRLYVRASDAGRVTHELLELDGRSS